MSGASLLLLSLMSFMMTFSVDAEKNTTPSSNKPDKQGMTTNCKSQSDCWKNPRNRRFNFTVCIEGLCFKSRNYNESCIHNEQCSYKHFSMKCINNCCNCTSSKPYFINGTCRAGKECSDDEDCPLGHLCLLLKLNERRCYKVVDDKHTPSPEDNEGDESCGPGCDEVIDGKVNPNHKETKSCKTSQDCSQNPHNRKVHRIVCHNGRCLRTKKHGGRCVIDEQCTEWSQRCVENKCTCTNDLYYLNGKCRDGILCEDDADCQEGYECNDNGKCIEWNDGKSNKDDKKPNITHKHIMIVGYIGLGILVVVMALNLRYIIKLKRKAKVAKAQQEIVMSILDRPSSPQPLQQFVAPFQRVSPMVKQYSMESLKSLSDLEDAFDVFISYRRSNGSQLASLLKVLLQLRGYSTFLDIEKLEAGHLDANLIKHIRGAKHFVLVLTPNALDRCIGDIECKDWVHREIVEALASGCNIVPVVEHFEWPEESKLPEDMKTVARFNAVTWCHEYQEACMDKLDRFLRWTTITNLDSSRENF